MKKTRRLAYLFWLLTCLPAQLQACPKSDCVRIGTWNIEWLGSEKRQQPTDAATLSKMAQLIAEDWSIDLITLQEINTDMQGIYRGEHYDLTPWNSLRSALERRGYQTAHGSSGYAQHIVFAWRHPVVALETPADLTVRDAFQINEFCRSSHLRKPLAGRFKAEHFDFWLIGLHLKANSGQTACVKAVRTEQANDLARTLPGLQNTDLDILLAGDFNTSTQNTSLLPLREAGMASLTGRAQRDAHSNPVSHIGNQKRKAGSGTLLDHIMVYPNKTREWQSASTMIFAPNNLSAFESRYSDHLPVWADFSTETDDD